MTDSYSFGAWVRKRRRALDLTQDVLALRVGCAVSMVRKIELDERRPSRQLAALLATGLELPESERAAFLKAARAELASDQLTIPEVAPAPARSVPRSNLPAPPTALLGRAHELVAAQALLARPNTRLLTLTGPGGTGKTRLALQLAQTLADAYADGTVFVDLTPLARADQVLPAIAQVLGVKDAVGEPLQEAVCDYLSPRRLLLLLDNFEHVLDAAELVAALLRAAPELTVLVTSRVVLRLSGEQAYPVPPLDEPAAVELFVARAQAAQPAFALTEVNAPAVAEICQRLDRMPLAIELAAARIRLFPPELLLTQLDDRFRVLTSGARDLPARQRALRATIDWSYHLLGPAEQRLFWRLAVFVGGWTLEAAEAVTTLSVGTLERLNVLDGLQALLDHSLIRQELGADGAPRFRRLETIRAYARERLAASGEERALRRRHAKYFCELAQRTLSLTDSPAETAWLRRLRADHDNLATALEWACGPSGDSTIALRLVAGLHYYWMHFRTSGEGQYWVERALALPSDSALRQLRADVLNVVGNLAHDQGDFATAERYLLQAMELHEALGDERACAESLNALGNTTTHLGQLRRAVAYQQASFERAQLANAQIEMAWALFGEGWATIMLGDTARAIGLLNASGARMDQLGSRLGQLLVKGNLGVAYYQLGNTTRGQAFLEDVGAALRVDAPASFYCSTLIYQAHMARERGDVRLAEELLAECLIRATDAGVKREQAYLYYELCHVALSTGDFVHAQQHAHESLRRFRAIGNPWAIASALVTLGALGLLTEDRSTALSYYHESLSVWQDCHDNQPVRQGGLVASCAGFGVAIAPVSAQLAVRLWAAAAAQPTPPRRVHATPHILDLVHPSPAQLEAAQKAVRATLGDAAFDAAWMAGQMLTLEQAIAEALALSADRAFLGSTTP